MKGCEPRDLLDRATDICLFENQGLKLTPQVVDIALAITSARHIVSRQRSHRILRTVNRG